MRTSPPGPSPDTGTPGHAGKHHRHHRSSQVLLRHRAATRRTNAGHQRRSRAIRRAFKPRDRPPSTEHLAYLATRAVSGHRDTHESTSDTTDRPRYSSSTARRHRAPIRGTNATPARSAELSRRETHHQARNTMRSSPSGPSPHTGSRSKAPPTPPIVPGTPPAPCGNTEHQYRAPTPLPRDLGCSQAASPKAQRGTPCVPRRPAPAPHTGTRRKAPATPPIVPKAPPAPCGDTEHQYGAPTQLPRDLGCSQAA